MIITVKIIGIANFINYCNIFSAIKVLVSLVNQVKEQNNFIIGKLDEVQNTLLNKQGAQDVKIRFQCSFH